MTDIKIVALTLPSFPEGLARPAVAIAACRAGAAGVLDLEYTDDTAFAQQSLAALIAAAPGECGIRCGADQVDRLAPLLAALSQARGRDGIVILAEAAPAGSMPEAIASARALGLTAVVEATSWQAAREAERWQAHAVIAKGHESGGVVGEETTFILLQKLATTSGIPVWAQGGIGLHSAAACAAAGARGLVLDSQLIFTRESPLTIECRARLSALDGTEAQALPGPDGRYFRIIQRPGQPGLEALSTSAASSQDFQDWQAGLRQAVGRSLRESNQLGRLLPLGQDIALAVTLSASHKSVASIVRSLRQSVNQSLADSARLTPFAPGSPLAESHGTGYPLLQGAMTRVSDVPGFALKVAAGGALPFLALALMRKSEIEKILSETAAMLGEKPWGVGLLGFVPHDLLREQLSALEQYRPPFALIAGGRPDQAATLEKLGIRTYLHVPSPILLKSFIEMGARRFIFEGRECGGHVGPRSSFVLWDSMISLILQETDPQKDNSDFHVVFAGGIHDAMSAAMTAAMAAPLAARGIRLGALMGTAYLFTAEAVETGAIVEGFQQAALACDRTVLIETGPGHAIRCIDSPYRQVFDRTRVKLESEGNGRNEIRQELEMMNLGRLRIASKGLARKERGGLATVGPDQQWQEGMYMIGQAAALHSEVLTINDLHEDVCRKGSRILASLAAPVKTPALKPAGEPVAIVGMSCLFPGASSLEEYWQNILDKVDAVSEVPGEHWDWRPLFSEDRLAPDKTYSRWGGFLRDVPFDPTRYGIPPASLASIDPMQLLVLETTRAALADAGYLDREFDRTRASVVLANAGHGPITALYSLRSMLDWQLCDLPADYRAKLAARLPEWTEDTFPGYLGNVAAGRVANRFDLGGTNFSIDAACASSLAALHVAMRELRSGESDMVLLTATDTHNQPGDYLSFSKVHALSPSGRCRTFDATADGIVLSEGIGTIVLKRLADAEADGDRIYAVIRGIGGSSDGRDLSLTAPSPAGQIRALTRAYRDAGISPASISLVEAHGTGTVAGDRAEVEALRQIFEGEGAALQSCAIGSVKTMIGHTKCAAGLASLIKVAKALHHKILPPTHGVSEPNPACRFPESAFYINSEARPWLAEGDRPRRAAVSAFGFGGTNFHTVLEEYTGGARSLSAPARSDWPAELFLLRGQSLPSLLRSAQALAELVRKAQPAERIPEGPCLEDREPTLKECALAWHLKTCQLDERQGLCLALVAASLSDLGEKLARAEAHLRSRPDEPLNDPRGLYFSPEPLGKTGKVAFVFPGQGSQQPNMLADLVLNFGEVRAAYEEADELLASRLPTRLSRLVYPPPSFEKDAGFQDMRRLTNTHVAQPAIGAASLGVLRLLRALNVAPDMVAGHSYGEYVALAAAGALDEAELILLSEARGRVLAMKAEGETGGMAAAAAGESRIRNVLAGRADLTIANINAPGQCIIAGTLEALAEGSRLLTEAGIAVKAINVSAAFHSPLMRAQAQAFSQHLQSCRIESPAIPVYANVDAGAHPPCPDEIRDRLARHIVSPVLFQEEIERMWKAGARLFVEVGPGQVLSGLIGSILADCPHRALPVERAGRNGILQLLHALAVLAAEGVAVQPGRLFADRFPEAQSAQEIEKAIERRSGRSSQGRQMLYLMNSASIRRLKGGKASPLAKSAAGPPAAGRQGALGAAKEKPAKEKPAAVSAATESAATKGAATETAAIKGTAAVSAAAERAAAESAAAPGLQALAAPPPAALKAASGGTPLSAGAPLPASSTGEQPAGARERVLYDFQRSLIAITENFLDAQKEVMLAYLGAPPLAPAGTVRDRLVPLEARPAGAEPVSPAAGWQPPTTRRSAEPGTIEPVDDLMQLLAGSAPAIDDAAAGSRSDSTSEKTGGPTRQEDLTRKLVEIVSERTGYPPDMLDPSLDLEADLGIDSIKRIEILNSFRNMLPPGAETSLESELEQLAQIKTLGGIVAWISKTASPAVSAPAEADAGGGEAMAAGLISRGAVRTCELAPPPSTKLADGAVVVVDAAGQIGRRLAALLNDNGHAVRLLADTGLPSQSTGANAVDMTSTSAVAAALDSIIQAEGGVAGIVYLNALPVNNKGEARRAVRACFGVLKAARAVVSHGGTPFIAATALGGDFACADDPAGEIEPMQAAVAGMLKSAAREWPQARIACVDFERGASPEFMAEKIAAELAAGEGPVEVGYKSGRRVGLEIYQAPAATTSATIPLSPSSLVLVTGGARGITARVLIALARRHSPTFLILGRTARPPESEPPEFAGLVSARELKSAIMESLRRQGKPVSIPAVESVYRAIVRDREVRSNLREIEAAGSRVIYQPVDVRDSESLARLVSGAYESFGSIDAFIHGAGVIEDALIADKEMDSFDRVFDTKATSALLLDKALDVSRLKLAVFFSSVVGRTGNAGQADYVAANEAINKLARKWQSICPGRVVSIMWGPWRGGMAGSEMESIFARHGWAMIEPDQGCLAFMEELSAAAPVEVLLVGQLAEPADNGETPSGATGAGAHGRFQSAGGADGQAGHAQELNAIR